MPNPVTVEYARQALSSGCPPILQPSIRVDVADALALLTPSSPSMWWIASMFLPPLRPCPRRTGDGEQWGGLAAPRILNQHLAAPTPWLPPASMGSRALLQASEMDAETTPPSQSLLGFEAQGTPSDRHRAGLEHVSFNVLAFSAGLLSTIR